MSRPRLPRIAVAAVTGALVAASLTSPATAAPSPGQPGGRPFARVLASTSGGVESGGTGTYGRQAQGGGVGSGGTGTYGKARMGVLPPAGQDCPNGTTQTATTYLDGFEGAYAVPMESQGFTFKETDTPAGKMALSSTYTWNGKAASDVAYPYLSTKTPFQMGAGRTYLSFVARGDFRDKTSGLYANDQSWALAASPEPSVWRPFVLDLTDAVNEDRANKLSLTFVNHPELAQSTDPSTFEIDAVRVYQCSATASRVRGDINGDGRADVIAVDASGELRVWPGKGDGSLDFPYTAGRGWENTNWIASVGDFNGDGRTDLWARDTKGDLWAYWGDGTRTFPTRTLIGTAWYDMVQIVLVGDMTGDGIPEMVGLDKSGQLWRYSVNGSAIRNKTLIGTGFNDFRNLLSTGDYNGDGTPDILGITKANVMFGYFTRAGSGTLSNHGTKLGEGWAMKAVSSPGDFDNNGFNDVLALGPTGDLVVYFVKDGRWNGSKLAESGFDYRLIG